MKPVRASALKLRLQGKSYNEINKALGIPKSTLSNWLSKVQISDIAQKRLDSRVGMGTAGLIKRNRMQTHLARKRAHDIQRLAMKEVNAIGAEKLLLIGAVLYWAEGYKRARVSNGIERTAHQISFVNADPKMIRIFVRFLQEILKVEQKYIRANMRLYEHIPESAALRYWVRASGLSAGAFGKTTQLVSISSQRKKPYNRLEYGTVQITVNSTVHFHKLMGWIEGVKERI